MAEGTIGADGRFNICWREFPVLLRRDSHEEYAYKVKQRIGPFTITIYDGDDLDFSRHHDNASFALKIAPEVCAPCTCEDAEDGD